MYSQHYNENTEQFYHAFVITLHPGLLTQVDLHHYNFLVF